MSEPPNKKRFPTFRYYYLNPEEQEGVVADKISGDALPGDGQLLIGTSGGEPVAANLSAGIGISITNGPGSVTISNTNAPDLNDGQVLIGITSSQPTAATLTAGSGINITNGPGSIEIQSTDTIIQVSSTTDAVTTSLTDVILDEMVVSPGEGNFLLNFHGSFTVSDDGTDVSLSVYKNGVKLPCCETHNSAVKNAPSMEHIGTMAYIVNNLAGDVIDIRWKISRGTGTFKDRMLLCQKIFT